MIVFLMGKGRMTRGEWMTKEEDEEGGGGGAEEEREEAEEGGEEEGVGEEVA